MFLLIPLKRLYLAAILSGSVYVVAFISFKRGNLVGVRTSRMPAIFESHDFEYKDEYCGKEIDNFYNQRSALVYERAMEIGVPLVQWWMNRKMDNVTSGLRSDDENKDRLNLRASELREAIVRTKSVTFIKVSEIYRH
jgi:hypothetical protein